MNRYIILFFIIPISTYSVSAQSVSVKQQEAFNTYINVANTIVAECTGIMNCLQLYYEKTTKQSFSSYNNKSCASEIPPYFHDAITEKSKDLASDVALKLNNSIGEIYNKYASILEKCQSLEAYTTLKEYEIDKFAKAYLIMDAIQTDFIMLKRDIENFDELIRQLYFAKCNSTLNVKITNVEQFMLSSIDNEKEILDLFYLNFNSQNFTNQFPAEEIQLHINKTDISLSTFKFNNMLPDNVHYQFNRFLSSANTDMQEMKRSLINAYTADKQTNDKFANEAYLSLLNYYHNLISIQHSVCDALKNSQVTNYCILKSIDFFPVFRINVSIAKPKKENVLFTDNKIDTITAIPKNIAIKPEQVTALNNYVDFINSCLQVTTNLPKILSELNNSCNYKLKDSCEVIARKGTLYFNKLDYFYIPLAEYEKALNDNRFLPKEYHEPLKMQIKQLLVIIKEVDMLQTELDAYCVNKIFRIDCFNRAYEILDRYEILLNAFHLRKEIMYRDLVKIYNAYLIKDEKNSWIISGKALWQTTEEAKSMLITARNIVQLLMPNQLANEKFKYLISNAVTNKYKNLKDLHELGRSSGHCPYGRYDNVFNDALLYMQKSDYFNKEISRSTDSVKLFNNNYIYLYNAMVDDYNTFTEIANGSANGYADIDKYNPTMKKMGYQYLLKQIKQPELFKVQKPAKSAIKKENQDEKIIKDKDGGDTFKSLEGYADNNMILLLDISSSMNHPDKLPLLINSFLKFLTIARQTDKIAIVTFADKADVALASVSAQNPKVKEVITNLKSKGGTNIADGITLAYKLANQNYIVNGNNRIILATDGEFGISEKITVLTKTNALKDIHLTVFSYGKFSASVNLKQLSEIGKGNYEIITPENTDLKLVMEAKAKKL